MCRRPVEQSDQTGEVPVLEGATAQQW
jgi:hypothetical protein